MKPFRHSWAKGAAAGFVLAILVVVAAYGGLAEGRLDEPASLVTEVVRVLAATVLFAAAPVRNAPETIQVVLLVAWWTAVGALAGWGFGKGGTGKFLAGFLLVAVIASHLHTKVTIERGIERALWALSAAFGGGAE